MRPTHCITCDASIQQPNVGRRLYCKPCAKARVKIQSRENNRKWRESHPEQNKKLKAEWYAANRKNNASWRRENKRRAKIWREKNQDHIRRYDKEMRP